MELPLVASLQKESRPNTSQPASQNRRSKPLAAPLPLGSATVAIPIQIPKVPVPQRLDPPAPLKSTAPVNILDFDVETYAAGFADPEYVPQKITCVAWSWFGNDEIESRISTPTGIFGNPSLRRDMLAALLEKIRSADMLVGQNIEWFDLPIINAECMRLGLEPIRSALVQDTKRLFRSKGFKKGQDNLCELFDTEEKKMSLNWQQWGDAYDENGWQTIRDRCESDVRANKQLRLKLLAAGYLRPPREWIGFR